jgi:uncharacterized NAD(P)/FAD-binding protein YdhS
MPDRTVVVAGGGASGTLLAAALVRADSSVHVVVVEPREQLGSGVAYATTCPLHLLNAPARAMSAFPDDSADFVRWLEVHAPDYAYPLAFAPRPIYGAYLHAIAREAQEFAGTRFVHVRALVTDAALAADGVRVTCSDGTTLPADALVVATGNAAPAAWPRLGPGVDNSPRFFRSAWDPAALVPADAQESVVLLGSGLTAVDAVLGLRANGHRGTIVMLSRRGLLPHEHRLFDAPPAAAPEAENLNDVLGALRSQRDWRGSLDGVRPQTNALWQALTLAEQRRFVRHAMPYWNVHRHRVAPDAAKTLAELIAAGTVGTLAGRTGEITTTPSVLRIPVRPRGGDDEVVLHAERIINCSGPEHDLRNVANPLIARLLEHGTMTPYPLNIGVQVTPEGALVGADGEAATRLFALGPVRYGTLIETTAIPEIAVQAQQLATLLSDRQRRARA